MPSPGGHSSIGLSVKGRYGTGFDRVKSYLVLLAVGIEHGYRVAIGNPDHATGKRFGLNRASQK